MHLEKPIPSHGELLNMCKKSIATTILSTQIFGDNKATDMQTKLTVHTSHFCLAGNTCE